MSECVRDVSQCPLYVSSPPKSAKTLYSECSKTHHAVYRSHQQAGLHTILLSESMDGCV